MRRDAIPLPIRVSYFVGIPLSCSLALLRSCWVVLPRLFSGQSDYTLGVHDPALWARLHAYLLVFGTIPAGFGLFAGLASLRRWPDEWWAWIGAITNGGFVLVAINLYWVLMRQGFFGFVLSALPRFLDV